MQNVVKRIISILFSLALAVFIIYQCFANFYSAYKTEIVMSYSISNAIMTSGVAIRDETIIYTENEGINNYLAKNGERVRKGSVVAAVYDNESDILLQTQINQLKSELEVLETSQDSTMSAFGYVDIINSQITEKLSETIDILHSKNCSGLYDKKTELITLLNKRKLSIGEVSDFSIQISELSSHIAALQSQISSPKENITVDFSGYFVDSLDGYEDDLSVSSTAELTVPMLNHIIDNPDNTATEISSNAIGKIISGFTWYLAVIIEKNSIYYFNLNSTITISFPYATLKSIPAVISEIIQDASGDYIVLFKCNYMSSELSGLRSQTVNIKIQDITGLRVNNNAIRFKDGVKGVYVLNDSVFVFKPITILYTSDDYSICEAGTSDNSLSLYDEIIVEGKGFDSYQQ